MARYSFAPVAGAAAGAERAAFAAVARAPRFTVPIGFTGWVAPLAWTGAAVAPQAPQSAMATPRLSKVIFIALSLAVDWGENHSHPRMAQGSHAGYFL